MLNDHDNTVLLVTIEFCIWICIYAYGTISRSFRPTSISIAIRNFLPGIKRKNSGQRQNFTQQNGIKNFLLFWAVIIIIICANLQIRSNVEVSHSYK